jgi:hypothetical protein
MSHADSKADKRRGESRKQKAEGKREKGKCGRRAHTYEINKEEWGGQ